VMGGLGSSWWRWHFRDTGRLREGIVSGEYRDVAGMRWGQEGPSGGLMVQEEGGCPMATRV
jgi:hypothetical protein